MPVHDEHPIGQEHRLVDAMGDEENRLAILRPDRLKFQIHLVACQRVERAEWFVHEQELRLADQRPVDGDALAHAARKFPREAILITRQADEIEQRTGLVENRNSAKATEFGSQQHIVEGVSPVEQKIALKHDADIERRRMNLTPGHMDRAIRARLQAGDAFQERTFSAAAGADNADEFAVSDRRADILERNDRALAGTIDLADIANVDEGRCPVTGGSAIVQRHGPYVACHGVPIVPVGKTNPPIFTT